jgi:hypothetical protein
MPAGRPSDYDPAYCDRVLELGRTGASVVEMATDIGVARATLEANWTEAHPEFLEAFTYAKQLSQVWWERKGRENLESQIFQASMWSRSMAARFPHDWREKTEVKQSIDLSEEASSWLGHKS